MTTTVAPDELLTLREVAAVLRESTSASRRRIETGDIPAIQLTGGAIRVHIEDLNDYLRTHRYVVRHRRRDVTIDLKDAS